MEHVISFLQGQLPREEVFTIEVAGITYPDKNYHITRERSEIYCIEYVVSGSGTVKCDDVVFHPKRGDAYLLPKGVSHDYYSSQEEPFQKIWMNVRGELCDNLYESYQLKGQYYFPACPIYSHFRRLLTLCENYKGNGTDIVNVGALTFHEIMIALAGKLTGQYPIEKTPVKKAKERMDLSVYDRVNMKELGKECGLSASQLTRVFQTEYGVTPYQYFLSQKLATACKLLQSTGMQIKEIAFKLQFSDEHYFSNIFHDKMGVSPNLYRKQFQLGIDYVGEYNRGER